MEALRDLSAAIHLDPNGSQAFYHRACLLRNSLPKQALKDFSVSLLLDDSVANVHTFIHRGVLYTQLKWYVSDKYCACSLSLILLNSEIPLFWTPNGT